MSPVTVTTSVNPPIAQIDARREKAMRGIRTGLHKAAQEIARDVETFSKIEAPRKSGGYISRFGYKRSYPNDMMFEVSLKADKDLSKLLRFGGQKYYPIVPKGKGYPLRFFWEKIGENVEFMKVNRQPMRADDWVERVSWDIERLGARKYYKAMILNFIETINGRRPSE